MDENTVLSLDGKVTEFSWKQPHVYLFVEVIEDDKPVVWSIQLPGINSLVRNRGWPKDTLVPGDEVFVRVNPAEDRRPYSKLQSIQRVDGRSHPDPAETYATGHSMGHWEDGTPVVDTRNLDDHRSPYQIGVPSGSQKHVVEKYRLIENAAAMHAEFMLEDPECLAEPMYHERVLLYSPHLKMLGSSCDLESTSQLLR